MRRNELQAGIFILFSTLLIIITLFALGKERQFFAQLETYHTSFEDVEGLAEDASVRLGGITIGRVEKIAFSDDLKDHNVHLTLLINNKYLERIRTDSKATINTQGLLGDRFLHIDTGTSPEKLPPGSTIESYTSGDISKVLEKAGVVAEEAAVISQNVSAVLKQIKEETLADLSRSVKSIANITENIESGDGLVSRLIFSKKDGDKVLNDLTNTADNISKIIEDVQNGKGLIHALIYDENGAAVVKDFAVAAGEIAETSKVIAELAADIKEGNGFMHDLVYQKSPDGLDEILQKLMNTVNNLEQASRSLAQGGGTLGALLIDSQIYDNLVEVTDEAKRSIILRSAIRSSLEKEETPRK